MTIAHRNVKGQSGHVFAVGKTGVRMDSFEKQPKDSAYRAEYEAARQSLPRAYRDNDAIIDKAVEAYLTRPKQKNEGVVQRTKARADAANVVMKEHKQELAVKQAAKEAKQVANKKQVATDSSPQSQSAASMSFARQAALSNHVKSIVGRYDAEHGVGALDRAIAADRAKETQINAQAMAQVNREFGLIFGAGPAIAGSIVLWPVAVEKVGAFIIAKTGLASTAAVFVKGGVGGTAGLAYTEGSTQALLGRAPTMGERIGSFTTGAVFAPGVFSITSKFRAPVNAAINGAAAGGGANVTGQLIDISIDSNKSTNDFSLLQLSSGMIIGASSSALGATVMPYYNRSPSLGSSQSIAAGANVGWREVIHAAPSTITTVVTQAHLDLLNALAIPETRTTPVAKSAK